MLRALTIRWLPLGLALLTSSWAYAGTAQTITFASAPTIIVGGTGQMNAAASSGLALTYSSQTASVCTVSGSLVAGVTAGVCTIAADQAGDGTYDPAPQTALSFRILNKPGLAGLGIINTVAGSGAYGYTGDGGAATGATLNDPVDVASDGNGGYYIADSLNNAIREVDAAGNIGTIAGGNGAGAGGDGGVATSAQLNDPVAIAPDGAGGLYIADAGNAAIRKVDASGNIQTYATLSFAPAGIALDSAGNLYVSDSTDNQVYKIDTGSVVTLFAGDSGGAGGYSGDGGQALGAQLSSPHGLAMDALGNLYIADTYNSVVRKVDLLTGVIGTAAGSGGWGYAGDGLAATDPGVKLGYPINVAVDGSGNLYISDYYYNVIRAVSVASGAIQTLAGTGNHNNPGFGGDGGAASSADLNSPLGMYSEKGLLHFADAGNDRVRIIHPFLDVSLASAFLNDIEAIYGNNITTGCGSGNYCPTPTVNRQQMAAFIVRAVEGEPTQNCTTPPFADVPTSNGFCKYIARMSALGITTGCGGGNYCPTQTVNRQQMAAFLVRAAEGEPAQTCTVAPFTDVPTSNGFCKYIARMSDLGITTGCGGGNYCPSTSVNRQQMGAFLARAFIHPSAGQCGSSNGGTFVSAPTTGLCNAGTADSMTDTSGNGSGPWTWNCTVPGGTTISCATQ